MGYCRCVWQTSVTNCVYFYLTVHVLCLYESFLGQLQMKKWWLVPLYWILSPLMNLFHQRLIFLQYFGVLFWVMIVFGVVTCLLQYRAMSLLCDVVPRTWRMSRPVPVSTVTGCFTGRPRALRDISRYSKHKFEVSIFINSDIMRQF